MTEAVFGTLEDVTYLSGLDASVMIWIASSFREEHLSAIRRLNDHTVDPFAFFAIKLRTVRIGDPAIALLLEVLEQPNDWEREAHREALRPKAEHLEAALGVPFRDRDGHYTLYHRRAIDSNDPDDRAAADEWLCERATAYVTAINTLSGSNDLDGGH